MWQDGLVGMQAVEGEGADVGGDGAGMGCGGFSVVVVVVVRGGKGGMLGECEALRHEVVVYECERTLGEEVGGDVKVAGGAGAGGESGVGEAVGGDVF